MLQKRKLKNLSHSLSSKSSIASMEMALAETPFQVSQVMEWVKSLGSFEKSTLRHSFNMVNGLKNKFKVL